MRAKQPVSSVFDFPGMSFSLTAKGTLKGTFVGDNLNRLRAFGRSYCTNARSHGGLLVFQQLRFGVVRFLELIQWCFVRRRLANVINDGRQSLLRLAVENGQGLARRCMLGLLLSGCGCAWLAGLGNSWQAGLQKLCCWWSTCCGVHSGRSFVLLVVVLVMLVLVAVLGCASKNVQAFSSIQLGTEREARKNQQLLKRGPCTQVAKSVSTDTRAIKKLMASMPQLGYVGIQRFPLEAGCGNERQRV